VLFGIVCETEPDERFDVADGDGMDLFDLFRPARLEPGAALLVDNGEIAVDGRFFLSSREGGKNSAGSKLPSFFFLSSDIGDCG
jgi:hypothetical protein